MPRPSGRFLRDNAFLVAAVALPVVVVGLFLVATAVPRMRVPPPAHDLVLRAEGAYRASEGWTAVFAVGDDGTLTATVRPVPANSYQSHPGLLLFDHRTLEVRELPFDVPAVAEGDPPRTFPVAALTGRRVVAGATAPDGYEFDLRTGSSPGIVGELFGMRRSNPPALVKGGRVVPLKLPPRFNQYYGVSPIGWIVEP